MVQPLSAATGYEFLWHRVPQQSRVRTRADGVMAEQAQCRTALTIVSVAGVRVKSCASRTRKRAAGLDPDTRHRKGSAMLFTDTCALEDRKTREWKNGRLTKPLI